MYLGSVSWEHVAVVAEELFGDLRSPESGGDARVVGRGLDLALRCLLEVFPHRPPNKQVLVFVCDLDDEGLRLGQVLLADLTPGAPRGLDVR